MSTLTVLYDPQCGLCLRVHEWLQGQPKLVELKLVPVKSEEARHRFPQLDHEPTANDLTVTAIKAQCISDPRLGSWSCGRWAAIASGPTASRHPSCCRLCGEWFQ